MLVLQRKVGERIVIDAGTPGEIVIEVVKVMGTLRKPMIRLGFTADRSIQISREELFSGRDGSVGGAA